MEGICQRIKRENSLYSQGNIQVYGHLLDQMDTI